MSPRKKKLMRVFRVESDNTYERGNIDTKKKKWCKRTRLVQTFPFGEERD